MPGKGQPLLVSLFQRAMPLLPTPVEANGSMTRKLTTAAPSTTSSFFPLAMFLLSPKLHRHPDKDDSNQADTRGNQYLRFKSQPGSFKEGAEDGCTNGDSYSSQVSPHHKQDDRRYSSSHRVRVDDSIATSASYGGPEAAELPEKVIPKRLNGSPRPR